MRCSLATRPKTGDLVAVLPPPPLANFLAVRRYLPVGMLLLKHIAALPGQTVCRHGVVVTIDGRAVAAALARDRRGPAAARLAGLPHPPPRLKSSCSIPPRADSFDGRYFGPLPASSIVGRAAALRTAESPLTMHPNPRDPVIRLRAKAPPLFSRAHVPEVPDPATTALSNRPGWLRSGLAAALLILAHAGKACADPAPAQAQFAGAAALASYRTFIAEAAQRFDIPAALDYLRHARRKRRQCTRRVAPRAPWA